MIETVVVGSGTMEPRSLRNCDSATQIYFANNSQAIHADHIFPEVGVTRSLVIADSILFQNSNKSHAAINGRYDEAIIHCYSGDSQGVRETARYLTARGVSTRLVFPVEMLRQSARHGIAFPMFPLSLAFTDPISLTRRVKKYLEAQKIMASICAANCELWRVSPLFRPSTGVLAIMHALEISAPSAIAALGISRKRQSRILLGSQEQHEFGAVAHLDCDNMILKRLRVTTPSSHY